MSDPERLGEIISRRRITGAKKGKLTLEIVKMNWSYIAGERLAGRSEPTRIIRGTLTVAAQSASWAAEVSMASRQILMKTGRVLGGGTVKKLKVRAGGYRAPGKRLDGDVPTGAHPDVELNEELREEIGRLEDKEIREALTRLLKASKASEEPGRES